MTRSSWLLFPIVLAFAPLQAQRGAPTPAPLALDQNIRYDRTGVGDTSLFAPLDLPPGNEFRSGAGKPGPKYWQNRADYDIQASLDTATKTLNGTLQLRYTNNSPDTLHFIWIQTEQNAFKNGSLNSYIFPQNSRFGARGFEGGDVITRFDQVMGARNGRHVALKLRDNGTLKHLQDQYMGGDAAPALH